MPQSLLQDAVMHARGASRLLGQTVFRSFTSRMDGREFLQQLLIIGNQSLPLIFGCVSFIGMISVAQAGLQLQHFVGNLAMVGPIIMPLFFREFAPTIAGLMLANRVGAGIAAELGSMAATEQVDALRMCNADPVAYLVVPRFWASVVMTVVLGICAVLFTIVAGSTVAYFSFHVNPRLFINWSMVKQTDVFILVLKSAAYGAAIPIAASYCGFLATGEPRASGAPPPPPSWPPRLRLLRST